MDYNKITHIELEGVDHTDYPDYCDAYISFAHYEGKEMTQDQLDELNDDSEYINQLIIHRN